MCLVVIAEQPNTEVVAGGGCRTGLLPCLNVQFSMHDFSRIRCFISFACIVLSLCKYYIAIELVEFLPFNFPRSDFL